MAKQGFGGQWVEIARVGKFKDSQGVERDLSRDFLSKVVTNYNAGNHEAAITIGHPELDTAPAFGWTAELKLEGDVLQARFTETNDDFEAGVQQGVYKKRSSSFYMDPPNLRHVAFLGAQPPAIKGLQNIKFADGESFVVEAINFSEEKKMEEKDLDQLPQSFWDKFKSKLGIEGKTDLSEGKGGTPVPQPASFTEAAAKELIAEALTAAKAEFKEQLDAKDEKILELTKKVDGQITGSKRAEIAAFVESLPANKGKHFLKRIHIADFLESLATADGADEKPDEAISFSEGEGTDKVDHKFSRLEYAKTLLSSISPMVEFGEKFGNITASAEADAVLPGRAKELQEKMGVKTDKGGDK